MVSELFIGDEFMTLFFSYKHTFFCIDKNYFSHQLFYKYFSNQFFNVVCKQFIGHGLIMVYKLWFNDAVSFLVLICIFIKQNEMKKKLI